MEKPVQITRLPKSRFYEKIFEIDERQHRIPSQIPLSRLSKLVSERVVTDRSVPVPECIPCGACCVYGLIIPINRREPEPLERYIEVTLDEAPDVVIERAFERDDRDGRCVNMAGEVGVEIGCTVYPDRPQICRDFDAGSDRCFGYRRMYGIDPLLTEAELEEALEKLDARPQPVKIRGIEIRLASKSLAFDRTATDPGRMMVEIVTLKIVAHMSDGEIQEIHTFDAAQESWYEHELEGITLEAALKRIEERRAVRK
jgi:Fe-S-cluster containining protein